MRIYTIWIILTLFGLTPFILYRYGFIPEYIFLSYIYLYLLFALALSEVMCMFLTKSFKDERRILFFTLSISVLLISVWQGIWVDGQHALDPEHFYYFRPIWLAANFPILGFLLWKISRDSEYLDVKHFALSLSLTSLAIVYLFQSILQVGLADVASYLYVGTALSDIVILALILLILSLYFKMDVGIYYSILASYFSLRYITDITMYYANYKMLDFETPLLFWL